MPSADFQILSAETLNYSVPNLVKRHLSLARIIWLSEKQSGPDPQMVLWMLWLSGRVMRVIESSFEGWLLSSGVQAHALSWNSQVALHPYQRHSKGKPGPFFLVPHPLLLKSHRLTPTAVLMAIVGEIYKDDLRERPSTNHVFLFTLKFCP